MPYLSLAAGCPLASLGGAYSNHLHALAYACRELGLGCRALIRGQPDGPWSPTLRDLKTAGAELMFVERSRYRALTEGAPPTQEEVPAGYYLIAQGGDGPPGAEGARAWVRACLDLHPTASHVWLAVGTGTTLAGAIAAAAERPRPPRVVGVWALKASAEAAAVFRRQVALRVRELGVEPGPWELLDHYHAGGFGKYPAELRAATQQFEATTGCPLDPVYTAKLMAALLAELGSPLAPPGAELLILHTGGLQGRRGPVPTTTAP